MANIRFDMSKDHASSWGVSSLAPRDSNLELLRIVLMLIVVAHHFACNSGALDVVDYSRFSFKLVFLQMFAVWGKMAINAFVLISGYFMCRSNLTVKRYCKVLFEVVFYSWLVYLVFLVAGRETVSARRLFTQVTWVFGRANNGFVSSFLWFYLFIPFYNSLIGALDRRRLGWLVCLLLLLFSGTSTFLLNTTMFNEVFWYMTLYFTAAYIRLYPFKWMDNVRTCAAVFLLAVVAAVGSVLLIDCAIVYRNFDRVFVTYFLADSNKPLAFAVAVAIFLLFKNLKFGNSRAINLVASTTFGVFCIHTASDAMRHWLYFDVFDVQGHLGMGDMSFAGWCAGSVLSIFVVCSIVDLVRKLGIMLVNRKVI